MVNLRRSSNAEQAEVTETFPRRERGAAEARGDRPPLRRRWVPAAVRPAHRSSGTTETQAASAFQDSPAPVRVCPRRWHPALLNQIRLAHERGLPDERLHVEEQTPRLHEFASYSVVVL